MRQAPPVKAELPPRQCSGETSNCSTEAPFSRADKAAQVAALPAPTTIRSCSGMSIAWMPLSVLGHSSGESLPTRDASCPSNDGGELVGGAFAIGARHVAMGHGAHRSRSERRDQYRLS